MEQGERWLQMQHEPLPLLAIGYGNVGFDNGLRSLEKFFTAPARSERLCPARQIVECRAAIFVGCKVLFTDMIVQHKIRSLTNDARILDANLYIRVGQRLIILPAPHFSRNGSGPPEPELLPYHFSFGQRKPGRWHIADAGHNGLERLISSVRKLQSECAAPICHCHEGLRKHFGSWRIKRDRHVRERFAGWSD